VCSSSILFCGSSLSSFTQLAPLLPKLDAILVLDANGNRLAGKYYGPFLKVGSGDKTAEDLRELFEKQVHQKVGTVSPKPDAAEIVSCQGRTVVVCGTADVRVVHVGPPNESELVLAHLCEGMYDALSKLMGGTADRAMVLDNLELVFLLIDEHCDGGIIMEVDGKKLAGAVLLRDEETVATSGSGGGGAVVPPASSGDMTLGQAFRQAREQLMGGMGGGM
jgi:coatomer subunit zeta